MRPTLKVLSRRQLGIADTAGARALNVVDQLHEGVHRQVAQGKGTPLNGLGAGFELCFRPAVAALAGEVDIQQWTADMMIADLQRPLTFVRHVAVGAGDP